MKTCTKCNIEKPLSEFYTRTSGQQKNLIYRKDCKSCRDLYVKSWCEKNKLKRLDIQKKYRNENPEVIKTGRRIIMKKKYQTDLMFRLKDNISSSVRRHLKTKKSRRTLSVLGCSLDFFIKYIESKFTEGMTWENHCRFGWHLDHIIPLASAKTEDELYKLNHYTNFQPLWWRDNLKKSDRIIETTNNSCI